MFRSCQIIIRELCSFLKLYYSVHNSIRICKRGVVAAYHVVWECVVEQLARCASYDAYLVTAEQSSLNLCTRRPPVGVMIPEAV